MGAVYFYHLTRSPLEAALPMLLERARAAGWRVLVRGTDRSRLEWLDERLWLGGEEEFLPHGLAGGEFDSEQPVLLTSGRDNPNDAACLISVDGAGVDPEEAASFERVCILFDGNDSSAVETARAQWKALAGAGCRLQYWAQEGGRWKRKAESG